jgi:2-polyprenyl-6-methoxyphenol hydroxylase-like FAD-dependent oxidoreductase
MTSRAPECFSNTHTDTDVLVVGAGPVGLLLANLLARRGIATLVVDKRSSPPSQSMAIGVTPPSLEILRGIGLDKDLEQAGVTVRVAEVHECGDSLGRLAFDTMPCDHRYILSIPQSKTVELLRRAAEQQAGIRLYDGVEFLGYRTEGDTVIAQLREIDTGVSIEMRSHYLVGCDGSRSMVRRAAGIGTREKAYRQRWVMGDFEDHSGLGDEAHLYFTPHASVESFPLPGGTRRWIVLMPPDGGAVSPESYLIESVLNLAGHNLSGSDRSFLSCFGAKRMVVDSYGKGRVALCGDAAHVMSSIGGQGMNTGFADADALADVLARQVSNPDPAPELWAAYDRARRRAWRIAATRAERSMALGTARGRIASTVRRLIIRDLLFSRWMLRRLPPHFAMLTIPRTRLAVARGEA